MKEYDFNGVKVSVTLKSHSLNSDEYDVSAVIDGVERKASVTASPLVWEENIARDGLELIKDR